MAASLLQFSVVFWLAAAPASGLPNTSPELPSGSSNAFREKMTNWSAEVAVATPVVVQLPQAQSPMPQPRTATVARLPRLSSRFGYRTDPLRGKVRMHSGIDIPAPLGTPIQASASGFVRFAGSAGGYGRMIEIAHGDGLTTRYAHLSQILVQPGSPIARGETIGLMGSTGRSTGSHLHFEVREHGRPANPLAYLGGAAPQTAGSFSGGSYSVWQASSEPYISQFARARAAAEPSAEK